MNAQTDRYSPVVGRHLLVWSAWVVVALLLLDLVGGWQYLLAVLVTAGLAGLVSGDPRRLLPRLRRRDSVRRSDLVTVGVLYLAVVSLMRLAFTVFTQDHVLGLFLCFAAALLLGVLGPIVHTVWRRARPLSDLGLGLSNWRRTAVLAVLFAGVQFALTLWGHTLPAPVDWVPLLVMALVVGFFESVFFRGFVQQQLEDHLGTAPGILGAALLYGLYHVGYGMPVTEIWFLTGLGVVYAVTFALCRNVLVLWPLLTPLGSFFANLETGDISLPWASILGFVDVFILMAAAVYVAERHHRRAQVASPVAAHGKAPGP